MQSDAAAGAGISELNIHHHLNDASIRQYGRYLLQSAQCTPAEASNIQLRVFNFGDIGLRLLDLR